MINIISMEPLTDPVGDRFVKTVPCPPHRPLKRELFFPASLKGKPDWKLVREHLQKEGRINKKDVIHLITETSKVLSTCSSHFQKTKAIFCTSKTLSPLWETFMGKDFVRQAILRFYQNSGHWWLSGKDQIPFLGRFRGQRLFLH